MIERKNRMLKGYADDHSWRKLVTEDTDFVRVINRGEYESLMREGRVTNRYVQKVLDDGSGTGYTKWVSDYDGGMELEHVQGSAYEFSAKRDGTGLGVNRQYHS